VLNSSPLGLSLHGDGESAFAQPENAKESGRLANLGRNLPDRGFLTEWPVAERQLPFAPRLREPSWISGFRVDPYDVDSEVRPTHGTCNGVVVLIVTGHHVMREWRNEAHISTRLTGGGRNGGFADGIREICQNVRHLLESLPGGGGRNLVAGFVPGCHQTVVGC